MINNKGGKKEFNTLFLSEGMRSLPVSGVGVEQRRREELQLCEVHLLVTGVANTAQFRQMGAGRLLTLAQIHVRVEASRSRSLTGMEAPARRSESLEERQADTRGISSAARLQLVLHMSSVSQSAACSALTCRLSTFAGMEGIKEGKRWIRTEEKNSQRSCIVE